MREQVSLSMPPALLAEVDRRVTDTRSAWINRACEAFLRRDSGPLGELVVLARKVATTEPSDGSEWEALRVEARRILSGVNDRPREW